MSSLLDMAKDTEKKLNAQASATEQMLKHVFSEHERRVSEALRSSEEKIYAAIAEYGTEMTLAMQKNQRSALKLSGMTWLTLTLFTLLLVAGFGSVLWWQGSKIASNQDEIARQSEQLAKLNAKTWGVTFHEEEKGRFLVLPKGTTSDGRNWTVGKGKSERNAVKLVKE